MNELLMVAVIFFLFFLYVKIQNSKTNIYPFSFRCRSLDFLYMLYVVYSLDYNFSFEGTQMVSPLCSRMTSLTLS